MTNILDKIRNPAHLNLVPDYKKTLDQVTLVFSTNSLMAQQQLKFLNAMPKDTQVSVIGWQDNQFLKPYYAMIEQPKTLCVSDDVFTTWACDLSIGDESNHVCSWSELFMQKSLQSMTVNGSPLTVIYPLVHGGNVLVTELKGKIQVLIGNREFERNNKFYTRNNSVDPGFIPGNLDSFEKAMSLALGGHQVKVIGQRNEQQVFLPQPKYYYHLDLWLLPYGPDSLLAVDPDSLDEHEPYHGKSLEQEQKHYLELLTYLEFSNLPDWLVGEHCNLIPGIESRLSERTVQTLQDEVEKLQTIYTQELRYEAILAVKNYLKASIAQLKTMGYQIKLVPSSSNRVLRYISEVNVILGASGDLIRPGFKKECPIEKANIKTLKSLGFNVKTVSDTYTHLMHGGPRCYFNRGLYREGPSR